MDLGEGMRAGDVLDGRYRLEETLGRGGFGVVWRATDLRLVRNVAVKVLLEEHAADGEAVGRFIREARTAGGLASPHIVTVHDFGRVPTPSGETHYLVMELVRGRSLADLLKDGVPSSEDALRWTRHVCRALDAAHRCGVVHRDIKPENVMIAEDTGKAKVLDFGIARLLTQSAVLTSTGNVVGTVPYLAPECWSGAGADSRADLYALGVMLYELCTGRRPFRAASAAEYMYKHLEETPAGVRTADPALGELIAELLAKNPADRPADAAEVHRRLRAVRPGVLDHDDPSPEQLRRRADQAWRLGADGAPGQAVAVLPGIIRDLARICGPADLRTLRTCHDLAIWLARDGSRGAAVALLRELVPVLADAPDARADALRDLDHWHREISRGGPGAVPAVEGRPLSLAGLLGGGPQSG
ncbi:serine/threonine protein kinase [Streptomyces kaniharaensis]|uniref:non-specific serine/threonine protein kinase n=1 Tax=Streptomyces kaniharaensis TaxID=212423 RepID=A0A6N7KUK2_9ACTN|nr:serine/threonine-protein kinase [Streptomyces kaniharaensis]MQS14008.1 serine/threonine protein kinase [Streptomyces kaniharaensis]